MHWSPLPGARFGGFITDNPDLQAMSHFKVIVLIMITKTLLQTCTGPGKVFTYKLRVWISTLDVLVIY